ncbi:DUF3551 domain-containing protein [Spirillospora sp. NBC_00431]
MRRVAATLGALVTAGVTTFTLTAPAFAATGRMTINGQVHQNPSGCYQATYAPLRVTNNTNRNISVYRNYNCTGQVLATVTPGNSALEWEGEAVRVP